MATSYLTLGQLNPSATTLTTLYTCPSSTQTVISSIVICNQSAVAATYRIAVRKSGASIDPKHYLVYDASIGANTTTSYTLGVTLSATDIVVVYASTSTMSFSVFGSEIA
jgi:hypothetical protein